MKCPIDNVSLDTSEDNSFKLDVNGSVMSFESNEDARFIFDLLNGVRSDYFFFNSFVKRQEDLNKRAVDLMREYEFRIESFR